MHKLVDNYTVEDSLVQYGDGLFETMLIKDNDILHWEYHWKRLSLGCDRLGITHPNQKQLIQSIHDLFTHINHSKIHQDEYIVIKMLVSRGKGLRGFASLDNQTPYVSFLTSSYQFNPKDYLGISTKYCHIQLPNQPMLAGIKHCNSLTYLLAKKELDHNSYQEGLLCNEKGLVIESITANLLLLTEDGAWITPKLDQSGVLGTFRQYFIDALSKQNIPVLEQDVTRKSIESARSLFLTNAVKGIIPIKHIKEVDQSFSTKLPKYIFQIIEHPCLKLLSAGF